ncbi:hypothetical protein C3942_16290 [Solimonas fluminis]|uniref:Uncharacterized protein n=1 Tax=Solimonas fluminis TaxID=2086571 RepID=A0A2S5TDB6_9GAMM|nr:hypothetical protein [Solimonas fluminis]PPE72975.1 hypothetical protein C3942_16290 [Solimonas fluminis]
MSGPSADSTADTRLQDFFRPGYEAADVAALQPLLQSREALAALMTVFHGTESAVVIRLLILREVAARGDQPNWQPSELRERFAYLDPAKLENVLQRLRENTLLQWDSETAVYQLSPLGRMVVTALSTLLKFDDQGEELGYIAGQIAAGSAVGKVDAEVLQHLLSRLNELHGELEQAVLSRSERRIRAAESRLERVWEWVEKSIGVIDSVKEYLDDPEVQDVAYRIARVQSTLLSMSSVFQRELNKLESQRVHLGNSGLSSADLGAWLRSRSTAELERLSDDAVSVLPRHAFLLGDLLLDVAEHELIDKVRPERLDTPLPPAVENAQAPEMPGEEQAPQLLEWLSELGDLAQVMEVEQCVPHRDFEHSSYRYSLLSLLGDPESATLTGPTADLARLPRRWLIEEDRLTTVNRAGVGRISAGRVEPT